MQNSAWLAQRTGLVRGGNIAVPMIDRDTRQVEQLVYSAELVVYQALERRDIQTAEGGKLLLGQQRDYREKRRLGLSGRRTRGEQQIIVGIKYDMCRLGLNRAQPLPPVTVDIFGYERRKARKYIA